MLMKKTDEASIAANAALAEPRFTIAEVSAATGIQRDTIRTWFKRGLISVAEEGIGQDPKVAGYGRLLSGYAAMVVAIMGRLTTGGVPVQIAKRAAYKFVFSGDDRRSPCRLFPDGETILVVAKDHGREGICDIRNFGGATGRTDWRALFFLPGIQHVEVLALDDLWCSTFQRLDLRAKIDLAG